MRQLSLWGVILGTGIAFAQPPQPTLPTNPKPQPSGARPTMPQPPGPLAGQPAPTAPSSPTEPQLAGRSLNDWIGELRDPDTSVRVLAIQAVGLYGEQARKALPT